MGKGEGEGLEGSGSSRKGLLSRGFQLLSKVYTHVQELHLSLSNCDADVEDGWGSKGWTRGWTTDQELTLHFVRINDAKPLPSYHASL